MDITILIEKLKGYLLGIWKYRWYGIMAAWLFALLGWAMVASLPDRYRASTRVFIDTQSLIKPLLKDISVSSDPNERINQVAKTIFNRPNLEKIAQMSDLDLTVHTKQDKEELLDNLMHDIQLRREGRANLFKISYEHENPNKARIVIQSILNLFVESTLSNTRTDTIEAQRFLDEQIDYYEEQLIIAENRLAEFKRNNLGFLPQQNTTYYDSLQKIINQVDQSKMKLDIAKRRQEEYKRQIAGEEPTFGLSLSQQPQNLNHPYIQKLHELEKLAINLQTRFTENHPDVINVKREIDDLQKNIDTFKSSMLQSEASQNLNENPVYQQMKMSLNEASAEVAEIQATVEELEEMANEMRLKVDEVIQTETELSNLNRDYLINKQKFQSLLERREAAKLAEEMDDTQQTIKFRVIDPPYVPSTPVGPKRGLFSIAVFLISLFFGVGVAFARSQIVPALFNRLSSDEKFAGLLLAEIPKYTRSKGVFHRYGQIVLPSLMLGMLFAGAIFIVVVYQYQLLPSIL